MLDTTLRDGAQASGVSLTLEDKVKIVLLLDELGVNYIEAGWPASNPKDAKFFDIIRNYKLSYAKIAAFGSTRRKNSKVYEDENINSILKADVDVAVIFGKAWSLHVLEVLGTSKEENLNMIYDTISYLRSHGLKVVFDAEHFYQGYKNDPEYALEVIKTAEAAGANTVVLCDTNGDTLPLEVYDITKNVVSKIKVPIGVHMHNDIGCAVANTIVGVIAGARHVHGTINGFGERVGNADLVQIVPTLMLKLGFRVLRGLESLKKLKTVSRLVYEILGFNPNPFQPYVGDYAFAHKAGIHVDAILKNPHTYEHIPPELVGNTRRVVLSELSGASNVIALLKDVGIHIDKGDPRIKTILFKMKELELNGYSFDFAPASAILVALKELGLATPKLITYTYQIFLDSDNGTVALVSMNNVSSKAKSNDIIEATVRAFSDAVSLLYSEASSVKILNIVVKTVGNSVFRVIIEAEANGYQWRCQGVANNMVEALLKGLVDTYEFYLAMLQMNPKHLKQII